MIMMPHPYLTMNNPKQSKSTRKSCRLRGEKNQSWTGIHIEKGCALMCFNQIISYQHRPKPWPIPYTVYRPICNLRIYRKAKGLGHRPTHNTCRVVSCFTIEKDPIKWIRFCINRTSKPMHCHVTLNLVKFHLGHLTSWYKKDTIQCIIIQYVQYSIYDLYEVTFYSYISNEL